jgi:hypothetical protein
MFRKLKKDMESDIRAAKRIWLPWWAVLSMIIVSLPIVWLFDHFGHLKLFLPTFGSVGMLALLIVLKWRFRRHAWFWATVVILAAVHVLVVLVVPWTDK